MQQYKSIMQQQKETREQQKGVMGNGNNFSHT